MQKITWEMLDYNVVNTENEESSESIKKCAHAHNIPYLPFLGDKNVRALQSHFLERKRS
jgi:hypothetical protein